MAIPASCSSTTDWERSQTYKAMSRQFATELNLRHECRLGTLEILQQSLAMTKALASENSI